jgi:Uma2 family endonuclease
MRLCVGPTGLYTYPDVMAVCGELQFLDAEVDTLLNPAIIIEVLSTTTESYDRGRKFRHYQQLASLQGYVLVAQDEVRVERFTRRGDDWILSMFTRLEDKLRLESIDCEVPLREIYDKVELSEEAARAAWLKRG